MLQNNDSTNGSFIKLLYTLSQAVIVTGVPPTLTVGDWGVTEDESGKIRPP